MVQTLIQSRDMLRTAITCLSLSPIKDGTPAAKHHLNSPSFWHLFLCRSPVLFLLHSSITINRITVCSPSSLHPFHIWYGRRIGTPKFWSRYKAQNARSTAIVPCSRLGIYLHFSTSKQYCTTARALFSKMQLTSASQNLHTCYCKANPKLVVSDSAQMYLSR